MQIENDTFTDHCEFDVCELNHSSSVFVCTVSYSKCTNTHSDRKEMKYIFNLPHFVMQIAVIYNWIENENKKKAELVSVDKQIMHEMCLN